MSLFYLDEERAVWRDIDGEAVIINTDSSVYYSLNRTGTAILSQVASGPCSLEGLARYVAETYAVAPEDATAAVRALLEQLQAEGLLGAAAGEEKPRIIAGQSSDPWERPTLTRHGELERLVLSGEQGAWISFAVEGSRARLIAKELQLARSILAHPLYFHGTSMEPLLVEGDGVAIEAVAWDEIRPGDIITYRFEDKFPTRRVVAKRSDRLLLVCDNWPMARFETPREDVLGRALGRLRAGSWLWSTDPDWRQARRAALSRCRPGLARRALGPLRRLVAGLGGGASGAPMAQ